MECGYIVDGMSLRKRARENQDTETPSDNCQLDEKFIRDRFTTEIALAACLTYEALTATQLIKMRKKRQKRRNNKKPAAEVDAAKRGEANKPAGRQNWCPGAIKCDKIEGASAVKKQSSLSNMASGPTPIASERWDCPQAWASFQPLSRV